MTSLRWVVALAAFLALLLRPSSARADPEREKYEMGVAALQHKDCQVAAESFNSIEGPLRQDPSFVNYAAQANECAGNLEQALEFYRQKEGFDRDKSAARAKIGALLYRISRENPPQPDATPFAMPPPEMPSLEPEGQFADARQEVRFVTANDQAHFSLEVENADGRQTCDDITFLKPCTLRVRSGPLRLQVTSGANFSADLQIPALPCTVTVSHDDGHGMMAGGLATIALGAGLVLGGMTVANNNKGPAGQNDGEVFSILGDIYGGIGVAVGLSMVLVDVFRDRDQATVSPQLFGGVRSFSPRLVGAAPFTEGRRSGGALVFEF